MEVLYYVSLVVLCFWTSKTIANGSNGQIVASKCVKSVPVFHIFQTSHCLMCPLNAIIGRCPLGTVKMTSGVGLRKCILSSNVYGCVHLCRRKSYRSVCCADHWGPDCQSCPGLESGKKACFGNGQCYDSVAGNGTCQCNSTFEGFACELCTNKSKFALKCDKDCTCKHGDCDGGVLGSGVCKKFSCKRGYYGSNCEHFDRTCNSNCDQNSYCHVDKNVPSCVCKPGYTGNGRVCTEIDPCINVVCRKNAVCNKTGPGQHECICRQGYRGDGVICTAIDPCQTNNGNCSNNTHCHYIGPGKANCTCLSGYENYNPTKGCSIINLCVPDKDCPALNAECVMVAPDVKECQCKTGYVGNGSSCHGNIIERISDLQGYGQNQDKFVHVMNIIKKHPDLTFAFTDRGPFTIFLPTDKGLEKKFTQSQLSYIITDKQLVHDLILVHCMSAFLPSSVLKIDGQLTTLKGWDAVVTSNGGMFYQLSGHTQKPSITRPDITAWNGVIHVIDEPVWIPDFTNVNKTSSKTLWQVISNRSELRTFRDFIQFADMQSELQTTANALTLIAPVNEAFVNFDKNDTKFLRSPQGKAKLQAILRHHLFGIKIGIIDLSYKSSIMSLAAELVKVNVTDKGAVLLGNNSKLIDNNIPVVNGYLYLTDNLMVPSFVLPIIKRYCDDNSKVSKSPCRPCRLSYTNGNCPQGTVTTGKREFCYYRINYLIGSRIYAGCRSLCVPEIKKCCKGFYGSDCSPCPGPVDNPCFGNGKCSDGDQGIGKCQCFSAFKGTACELCKDGRKFGLDCTKLCTCVHGTCDNGRFGNGSCVPNTCVAGFQGVDCAISVRPCAGDPRVNAACHIHANCYVLNSKPTCICKVGYEQIWENCYEIDPCLKAGRGGCDKNAICTKTGPGRSTCTCSVGWTGDGKYCSPINYCAMPSNHCHRNAKCTFLGPAQVKCDCHPGYEGDGTSCREINTCLRSNGNCSPLARCVKTGPGKNKCVCRLGYLGDGVTCLSSLSVVVQKQNKLSIISSLMVKYNLVRYLADPSRNITVFLPSDDAISNLDPDSRKKLDLPINLYYLGGSNSVPRLYNLTDLRSKTIKKLPSLFIGVYITINHTDFGEPRIGGTATITTPDIAASNGILHIVDKVLFPFFAREHRDEPTVYEGLCGGKTNFGQMCTFINKFNLQEEMKSCNFCSIFVPTDEAFYELSYDHYHHNLTREDILFHMTNHFLPKSSIVNGQQFASLAGPFYMLSFETKSGLEVNGVNVTYYKSNSTWFIYTIPKVLKAVMNTCYQNRPIVLKSTCRPCRASTLRCRPGFRYAGKEDCFYLIFGARFIGCRAVCVKPVKVRQCCPGFYGKFCSACPGENGKPPCFGNGKCDDTLTGSGHCDCTKSFSGQACERCEPGHFGSTCKSCGCYGNATCDQNKGFCHCPRDRKGLKCNKTATYDKCFNAGNKTILRCAKHASCSKNETKNATCICDHGFTGSGESCKRIDPCSTKNRSCSPHANCKYDAVRNNLTCTCQENYEGDGYWCRGKNPCQEKDRLCHPQADCHYLLPGRFHCKCKPGYSGDGANTCQLIDLCSLDNGGCSFFANCAFNKSSFTTTCKCKDGYVGDGIKCIGNVFESLQNDPNLREFHSRLLNSSITQILSPENYVSVVAPNNSAFTSSRRKRRSVDSLSDLDLKHYIVSCVVLNERDVKDPGNRGFVTIAGSWLNITSPMVINNNVKILNVTITANSAILVVDKLLDVPDGDDGSLEHMTLTAVAKSKGYKKFAQLLTDADMLDIESNIYNRPHTTFWPSDEAFSRLPNDIQKQLSNKDYARDIINYHIIEKTKITTKDILGYSGGLSRRTREGSPLYISCKGHKGDLYVNDRSKIIERDIGYQGGIAFGVSDVLLPPGFAGRCDGITYEKLDGSCTGCGDNGLCPANAMLESVDKNSSCVYQGQYIGCLSRCVRRTKEPKCCKNFYGENCQECPGGLTPCSGRGVCADGISGSGNCTCKLPFVGTNCEICRNDNHNCSLIIQKLCTSRDNPCSIFAICNASGPRLCQCMSGYKGDGYYCRELDKCQKNNGGCSTHAICKYTGPNSVSCECRSGYVGDGVICTALPPTHPCVINNGNCHVHAQCTDKGGAAVCRCRQNFVGNGIYCKGSVKDVIYDVEVLSEFSKNMKRLSIGVEGHAIIRRLSSEKEYTVFAPVNYGFTLDRMNINQLKNHIVEGKLLKFLKPGTTKTVYTLARNKITVVVSKNNKIRLNKIASVVSDYPATNGIVILIDHVLPYKKPPPATPRPTSEPTTGTRVPASVNHGKDNYVPAIVGGIVGFVVFIIIVAIAVVCFKKCRKSYDVKYNRNFENVPLESEAYTEEDHVDDDDDDEYEHQILQHPSAGMKGTTLQNPTYVGNDADIRDDLLEMTETSSSVPLTKHDAVALSKEEKC